MIRRHHRWYLLIAVALAAAIVLISRRHPAPPLTETAPATFPPPSATPPPPPVPAAAPPPAAPPPGVAPVEDEAHTLARARDAVHSHPDQALALLDALDRRHPGATGAGAEERAALRVDALVAAGRIGVARDAAEDFLRRYPQSPRAEHIEVLTGVHPRPSDPSE